MRLFFLFLLSASLTTYGQEAISNKGYFKKFLRENNTKSLIIVGENHASAVSSNIYPGLIKYLHKKTGLNTLLIEFGPAEAYFYSRYLQTGDEKNLNYTIYAGAIKGWREAWREIYAYNKSLKNPLKFIGIDFDRTRTLAYALFSIFKAYDQRPDFVDSLMKVIRTDEFYKTYTIGYPTKKDIQWTSNTKSLLKEHFTELESFMSSKDLEVMSQILQNKAVGYDKDREKAISENVQRIIENTEAQDFLLLIGRSHAYLNPPYGNKERLANLLIKNSAINVLTGVMLFQNSELWATKKKVVKLFEIEKKAPWKRYDSLLNKKAKKDLTIIPLRKSLCPLAYTTDYVLIARNQKPYELLHPPKKK